MRWLRAVLDTVFSVVVRAQRALDHEMERQADLVAVTLTGSDSLVHALHKLGAADMAWDRALGVAAGRHAKGELVGDLFAMQSRVLEHDRRVLADETHGVAPPLPTSGRAEHRLFEERIANPPKMWSSHPPNRERETPHIVLISRSRTCRSMNGRIGPAPRSIASLAPISSDRKR